jgi:hypothetical protein
MSYAVKLGAAAMGLLIVGVILVLIFSALWFRIGLGTAIILLSAILIYFAWRSDKKAKEERAGLENI